jgi:hypothetical protein
MDMIKLYNVHALVHLADDASQFGALENIFHFTYETFLHYLSLKFFLNVKFVRYSVHKNVSGKFLGVHLHIDYMQHLSFHSTRNESQLTKA